MHKSWGTLPGKLPHKMQEIMVERNLKALLSLQLLARLEPVTCLDALCSTQVDDFSRITQAKRGPKDIARKERYLEHQTQDREII
jgi:hypothetical protein